MIIKANVSLSKIYFWNIVDYDHAKSLNQQIKNLSKQE